MELFFYDNYNAEKMILLSQNKEFKKLIDNISKEKGVTNEQHHDRIRA